MSGINLNTPLAQIRGIAPRFLTKLKKLKIETVKDLLWHFPSRYEDFSVIYKIADLQPNQQATIQGRISKINLIRAWRRRMFLVTATIEDETGEIRAIWFNQPYIKNVLKEGSVANFAGKISSSADGIYLSNPSYEINNLNQESKHTGRLVPIYPETRGLTSRGFRFLIKPVLDSVKKISDFLPEETAKELNFPEINRALKSIHFPESIEEAEQARKRFAFEDLFLIQIFSILERQKLKLQKAHPIKINIELLENQIAKLPFELTNDQQESLKEILSDLEKPRPMSRLLEGDVGSGKTVIAALAAAQTADNQKQAAFLAPTEVLANQHFETIKNLFADFEGGVALMTSIQNKIYYGRNLETEIKKPKLMGEVSRGNIKIIIGTHSLIQKGVRFKDLALAIVDEQHRFGVEQRAKLAHQGTKSADKCIPHFLSMSATPIPRTLTLALFGDLDLSLIKELPKDRKEIITKIVAPENRDKAYAFIRGQVKKGRQVFVICPRIEASGEQNSKKGVWSETKTVKEEYEKLSKKIFPDLKVAMLHGKIKAKEKDEIMKKFNDGKTDILVSTSVIEVGVNVPNATIMMIESAERFGLASLYQFRGRIGRGEHQSFCFLFTESSSEAAQKRLKALLEAKNGFELAEKDLAIRGPGEILGKEQSGIPDLAMRSLKDFNLVKLARQEAEKALTKSPDLKKYPTLKIRLDEFKTKYFTA